MSTLTASKTSSPALSPSAIHRIEVWPRAAAGDPLGDSTRSRARELGVMCARVRTAHVYLLDAPLSEDQLTKVRDRLLADPVLERAVVGSLQPGPGVELVEVHPLPGVMDPVAQTVQEAIESLVGEADVRVVTGRRYDFEGITCDQADMLASRLLANSVIESVHREPFVPESFPRAALADQTLRHIEITTLTDAALETLSREGHLFLSLEEMRGIQAYYRERGCEPTDVELESLAQTWSEHCVHKTLKSTVRYTPPVDDIIDWTGRPGCEVQPDGSVIIHNLLKSTVVAATHELVEGGLDWTLSVFVDNAGIIAFDDEHAVCVKVETHNHPSAIEPYGGAATGVGGCIRDIMGTGRAAKPIANTDVFCVALPDMPDEDVPDGCLHPKRILTRVVEGVRDYGNRMGIPTVNGAVHFDDRYVGNPLVFCGCIGVMPRDRTHGEPEAGDHIIVLGGRTGRDGIHGATFSSAELTETHADEFSHAVQIGNPIEEKRTLDAILRARDHVAGGKARRHEGTEARSGGEAQRYKGTEAQSGEGEEARCLFSAITDCGAGGFSSAVGEMGEKLGAEVHLDRAPLKYAGLRYDEIWISESQERMVLAVPTENLEALEQICDEESVEMADLGTFGTPGAELILHYAGSEVGRLGMEFLHEGIPMPTREAKGGTGEVATKRCSDEAMKGEEKNAVIDVKETLLDLLRNPNIASKRWIVRQYDHEVQGNTIIKPLVGPGGVGPGDATVIQPVPGSKKGLAIACGMASAIGDPKRGGDPYLMALAAVDECVRNLVCVGGNPDKIAILDNFCWPSCEKPENMGALVRACMGCYDAAKAYGAPFISGKDSLNNQFRTKDGSLIEIPPTLLITGVAEVEDVTKCVTMDVKGAGSQLVWVGHCDTALGGSQFERRSGMPEWAPDPGLPVADPAYGSKVARAISELVRHGLALSVHDVSDGGGLVSISEMLIAAHATAKRLGATIDVDFYFGVLWGRGSAFAESPHSYIVETRVTYDYKNDPWREFHEIVGDDVGWTLLGEVDDTGELNMNATRIPVSDLSAAFHSTLDW